MWFRNRWSWGYDNYIPKLFSVSNTQINAEHNEPGNYFLYFENNPEHIFCDNITNLKKLYNIQNASGYYKDGINEYIVNKNFKAINNDKSGTKAGLNYFYMIPPLESVTLKLRLTNNHNEEPFKDFDEIFSLRINEADLFYEGFQKDFQNTG